VNELVDLVDQRRRKLLSPDEYSIEELRDLVYGHKWTQHDHRALRAALRAKFGDAAPPVPRILPYPPAEIERLNAVIKQQKMTDSMHLWMTDEEMEERSREITADERAAIMDEAETAKAASSSDAAAVAPPAQGKGYADMDNKTRLRMQLRIYKEMRDPQGKGSTRRGMQAEREAATAKRNAQLRDRELQKEIARVI
jgi:hypothetical protein